MRAKDVVGRKIVRVIQTRCLTDFGEQVWHVDGFELDNGKIVHFSVCELPGDYAVEASMWLGSKKLR